MFSPLMKSMEHLPLVCLCLLTWSGITSAAGNDVVKVVVEEGSDAILPCSPSTKEDLRSKLFDWTKDGRKEVFLYDAGDAYKKRSGQDDQFKGRVSHFEDELEHGNASIKIINTKLSDSGVYSCIFPHLQPSQTFLIELVVGPVFKDRLREISSAAAKPYVKTVETKDGRMLQCEVQNAKPKPKVEWRDSAGNILHAEEPQVTERGGSYDIILKAKVTKTDNYRCNVTQEEINHKISNDIYVKSESHTWLFVRWIVTTFILLSLVCFLLYKLKFKRGSGPGSAGLQEDRS